MGTDKKPGLYEVTSAMTWIQSPFPQGMVPPAAPTTTKVCLTQEQIDKFGGGTPQTRGNCAVSNVVMKPGKVSADMTCTGQMTGKGTFESTWSDPNLSTDSMHFTGEMRMGPNTKPVEWKTSGTSKFLSADCGSVKPLSPLVNHEPPH
jgi:hypothetical protein